MSRGLSLFSGSLQTTDHRWYRRLASPSSERSVALRAFCLDAYRTFADVLDADFVSKFRNNTPAHFSELFFAQAFHQAGWESAGRVNRVDLAFKLPDGKGRLLVEVTTPRADDKIGIERRESGSFTFISMDGRARQASLLRLTSAFKSKADDYLAGLKSGSISGDDFKVIAISGLKINQEGGCAPKHFGLPPCFSEAFLPIGRMYVPVRFAGGAAKFGRLSFAYDDKIAKPVGLPVDRDAFISGSFCHIDAVAYSEINLSYAERSFDQVGVLYNPTAVNYPRISNLRMAVEYHVEVEPSSLCLRREVRSDLADRIDSDGE